MCPDSRVTTSVPSTRVARYAVVYYNNMAYVFRGATRLNSALAASDPFFLSSIKTFRRLRDNEFALAEPDNVVVRVNGNRVDLPDGSTFVVTAQRITRATS